MHNQTHHPNPTPPPPLSLNTLPYSQPSSAPYLSSSSAAQPSSSDYYCVWEGAHDDFLFIIKSSVIGMIYKPVPAVMVSQNGIPIHSEDRFSALFTWEDCDGR